MGTLLGNTIGTGPVIDILGDEPASEAELKSLRKSCVRGTPYGSPDWVIETAKKLGLDSTLRSPGRPKKR